MAYPTVDEEFNDQAYAGAGLQPSVGERATMPFDSARQFGNNATRVTGVAMRKGGKVMQRSGSKMMRTGATLSRSGAGALVGVPLMATGAAMSTGGRQSQQTERNFTNRTQRTKKLLRAKGLLADKVAIRKRAAATRINLTALSIAAPIWFTIQLPLALAAIVALAMAGIGDSAEQILGEYNLGFLYSAYDTVTNGVEYVTGINLNIFEGWAGFSQVLFGGFTMLVFLIGLLTLGTMAALYTSSGVRCFFGEHSTLKMGTFIFGLLGYLMPILNILPWFILWGIVVWRYPK